MEDTTAQGATNRSKKKWMRYGIIAGIIIGVLLLVGGGLYAAKEYHEKYIEKVSVEKILPGGADLVLRVAIDPTSEQFVLMEKNAEKFPAYDFLKQNLDEESGEEKTLSQIFQEKTEYFGLDFVEDVQPVLSETAYIIVSDMDRVESFLYDAVGDIAYGSLEGNPWKSQKPYEKIATSSVNDQEAVVSSQVLGRDDTRDDVLGEAPKSKEDGLPLDIVFASEIQDLKQAKETLEKIKTSSDQELEEKKHEGFTYYKISIREQEDEKEEMKSFSSKFIPLEVTYHALLGGNWVITSQEGAMQSIIERRHALHFSFMGDEESFVQSSLGVDETYKDIFGSFSNKSETSSLLEGYYKINMSSILSQDACEGEYCYEMPQYFKYPEEMVRGLQLQFEDEGMVLNFIGNDYDLGDIRQSESFDDGFSSQIPQKIGERWVDVFVEYENPKSLYYSFKETNLTEEGKEFIDEVMGMYTASEVDFEEDVIDQLDGNAAFVMATAREQEPIFSLIMTVSEPQKMVQVLNRAIEAYRKTMISALEANIELTKNITPEEYGCNGVPECEDRFLSSEKLQQKMKALQEVQIVETKMSGNGLMYSFNVPESDASFDFGYKENVFIVSSHYAGVEDIFKKISGENTEMSLSENSYYQTIAHRYNSGGYARSFIHVDGVIRAINFYLQKLGLYEFSGEEFKQGFEVVTSNIRTINLIGGINEYQDPYMHADTFFQIKELPREEKERAKKYLEMLSESISSARDKAQKASIKASMSSTVPAAIICTSEGGEVISGEGGSMLCSVDVGDFGSDFTWPVLHTCGSEASDVRWTVQNGTSEEDWIISLECSEYTECDGTQNASCSVTGCSFQGLCD